MSNFAKLIEDRVAALSRERAQLLARVEEIDRQLASVAESLGAEPSQFQRLLPPEPSHHAGFVRGDGRVEGTMPHYVLEILFAADRGYSRTDLRRELDKHPVFGARLRHNVNSFYNTIKRYIDQGKIIQIDKLLYHPDRAPLPDGEEDPTGQHLPSNVSSLFGQTRKGVSDV